jgi:hypothetical protein
MVTMRWLISAVVSFALLSACLLMGQQPGGSGDCLEQVFSGAKQIAVSEDYAGTGFVLSIDSESKGAAGSRDEDTGGRRATTALGGVLLGNTLRLEVERSEGELAFTGELSGRQLKCTLVWYI